jgi:UDP-glucuronate 4-epimerase
MKIMITGVAGFIGFHVANRLLSQNFEIVGIDNVNNYYDINLKHARLKLLSKYKNFNFLKYDVSDEKKIEKVFNEHKFLKVLHFAGQAGVRYSVDHPEAYLKENIQGFFNIMNNSRLNNVAHFIYASSSSVYGDNPEQESKESDYTDTPISFYAATKKSNELMAHSFSHVYGMQTTGLRFFTVYGPWGRPDMALSKFTKSIIDGEAVDLYNRGEMVRDFTYIDDVVDCVVSVLDGINPNVTQNKFNVFNVGNGKPRILFDYIYAIEKSLGIEAKINLVDRQVGDVLKTVACIDKINNFISYKPKFEIEEGVANFIEWYRGFY